MPFASKALEILPQALEKVWPLKRAHRVSLPDDIAELSTMLTSERSMLRHGYWSRPRFVSAYLYYFLPWNILRQTRLLQGLTLPSMRADCSQNWLFDAGSGTLSLPLALWLAKPELRSFPLKVLALDKSRRPVELGKGIFKILGNLLGEKTWPISIVKGTIENSEKIAAELEGKVWLFSAANILNEINSQRSHGKRFTSPDFDNEDEGHLEKYFEIIPGILDNGASYLVIEPGTRPGGECMMRLREFAIENGFFVQAPCTHQNKCPLLARNQEKEKNLRASLGSSWCHFTFDILGAPKWLTDLSRQAGLAKNSLSLSPLLLSSERPKIDDMEKRVDCRIISRPFAVPGISQHCRYGCVKDGLALLPDADRLENGSCLQVSIPAHPAKDKKSGAVIL